MTNYSIYSLIKYIGPGYLMPWISITKRPIYQKESSDSSRNQKIINTYALMWLGVEVAIQCYNEKQG